MRAFPAFFLKRTIDVYAAKTTGKIHIDYNVQKPVLVAGPAASFAFLGPLHDA